MGMIEIGPRDELKRIYNKPENRKLKYCAIAAISIAAIFLLVCLIWMDCLSITSILLLRGFTGLFAIIFVVLYSVLLYRVNREYIKGKY